MAAKSEQNGAAANTLARGLKLVQILTEAPAPMSLARIARASNLDNSTCHRMLQTLSAEGWAVQDGQTREYAAGPHALVRCAPWHPLSLFKQQARSLLERLNERTKETACLIVFPGTERVIVDVIHGRLTLSSYYDIRLATPLHGSASGKILLASMPKERRDELLGQPPFAAATAHTPSTVEQLEAQLDGIKKNGVVVSREEAFMGLVAYGAPITYRAETLGCVVVTCSSDGREPLDDDRLSRETRECGEMISSLVPAAHQLAHFLPGV